MAKDSDDNFWSLPIMVVGFIFLAIFILTFISNDNRLSALEQSKEASSIEVRLEQPEFLLKGPREGLMEALEYYKIPHKEIVFAQAYLETGNFKSNQSVNNNNLFGLYNSKLGRYMSFEHWSASVETYKKCFSDRYTDTTEDYYHFLTRVGYAEDPNYIQKVKQIQQQLFKND